MAFSVAVSAVLKDSVMLISEAKRHELTIKVCAVNIAVLHVLF